jgi:ABC-type lipoprotein release transport system permease subunit
MALPLRYTLGNLFARRARALLTASVVALAVLTVALVSGLISGIKRALVTTGDSHNLVVLRKGADNEGSSWLSLDAYQIIRSYPQLARGTDAAVLVSPELIVQPFMETNAGQRENVLVRGVLPVALEVHKHVTIVQGRMFAPGTTEVVIGRSVADRYKGARVGEKLRFGRGDWTVVGIFEDGGSSFQSEVWADAHQLAEDARRALPFSAIYLRADDDSARNSLKAQLEADPRLGVSVQFEEAYYKQRAQAANALYGVLMIIALLSGASAAFGATNTLHAAVQSRTAEIGTLRALGFPRGAIIRSLLLEALAMGVIGFIGGIVAAAAIGALVRTMAGGVGIPTSTFSTMVVELRIGPVELVTGLLLAVSIGLLGGLAPALRGARMLPALALRCR